MVTLSYYQSPEWQEIRRKVLKDWDGFCEMCGEELERPIVHHMNPFGYGDEFNKIPLNPGRSVYPEGVASKEYLVVCEDCHHEIYEWIMDPANRLYHRICEGCGEEVFIGFDREQRIAFELDGRRFHYCLPIERGGESKCR